MKLLTEMKTKNISVNPSSFLQGVKWSGEVEDLGWGAKTEFTFEDQVGTSVYVYLECRGQGHMSQFLREHPEVTICTVPSCDLESYLK